MSEFWDNNIPGYGKTRKLSSADKKKVNTLVTDIITKLTDEYDAETADAVWVAAKAILEKYNDLGDRILFLENCEINRR